MANVDKRMERLQVTLDIAYESWANATPFGILTDENTRSAVQEDYLPLFDKKSLAVLHKREMVWIAGAEVKAVCDHVIARNKAAMPYSLSSLLTLKIESFLMMARSLLDVLSTAIAIHQLRAPNVQSFNDLRKRRDCPKWLSNCVQAEMITSTDLPISKIGWMSFLLSEPQGEKCLRDFVSHRGVAAYHFRELPFEEGWDLVFQPRAQDNYVLPIQDVVEKILNGVASLARLIDREFAPKSSS